MTRGKHTERRATPAIRTRVLLIEDNCLLGEAAAERLNSEPDMKVVTIRGIDNGELTKYRPLKPQVILFDSRMGTQRCVEIVRSVRAEFPSAHIIVMDLDPQRVLVPEIVKEGVSGFILRDATLDDYLASIRGAAANGKTLTRTQLSDSPLNRLVGRPATKARAASLSQREQQIVRLVAEGYSNLQIASELELSIHTVKSHIHNILSKLALRTRLELARHALTRRRSGK